MTDMVSAISGCRCNSDFNAVKIRINNPKTIIDGNCKNNCCNNNGNNTNGIDIEVNNPKMIYTSSIYDYKNATKPVNYTNIYSTPIISLVPAVKQDDVNLENIQQKNPNNRQELEIIPPVDIVPEINLHSVIQNLQNEDYNVQRKEMENIVKVSIDGSEKLKPYLVQDVILALTDIAEKDTTSVGTSEIQKDAEKNKVYALHTLAVLAKAFSDLIKKEGGNTVPLAEIPGIPVIIKNIQENPNPEIKAYAKEALELLRSDEYKQEIDNLVK